MSKTLVILLVLLPWVASATNEPEKAHDENDSTEMVTETGASFFDTAAVYTNDWNNNVTFRYPEANFSPKGILSLVDTTFGYAFPVEKKTTSGFGGRRNHKGIDIPIVTGEKIVAAFGGKVRYAKWNSGGFGNLVIIRHPNGLETYYAHLSKLKVKPNQVVKAGDVIGLGGSTGRSYSPHLHFEVRYNHVPFDPEHIFDLENYCLRKESLELTEVIQRGRGKVCTHPVHTVEDEDDHKHDHTHDDDINQNEKEEIEPDHSSTIEYHTVRSGDTLSKIGSQHGRSVDALCQLNGLSRTSILQIGQKIRVQ